MWLRSWGCSRSLSLVTASSEMSFLIFLVLFLLLVWLSWLALPVLCWIGVVKVDIPVLFLILKGMLLVFAHWMWCWQWICHIWPLLCLGMFPLMPVVRGVFFIINGCWIYSNAFSASVNMIMWFLSFILFMWYITLIDFWILNPACICK